MKSTELATKFKTICDELNANETYSLLLKRVLNDYGANYNYESDQITISKQLTHLDRTIHGYSLNHEYKEIIKLFGFTNFINQDTITDLIAFVYKHKTTHDFIGNHIAYKSMVRVLTFLETTIHTNDALQKLLIEDKKIPLTSDTSELTYTLPDTQGKGYDIDYITNVLTSIKSLYDSAKVIEGDEVELKVEYMESGSSIIIAFIGSLPVIKYVLKIIEHYYRIRYDRLDKSIEHYKESVELSEWINKKVEEGVITREQADSSIKTIFEKLDSLHGFNLSDLYQDNMYILNNDDDEVKQLPE